MTSLRTTEYWYPIAINDQSISSCDEAKGTLNISHLKSIQQRQYKMGLEADFFFFTNYQIGRRTSHVYNLVWPI